MNILSHFIIFLRLSEIVYVNEMDINTYTDPSIVHGCEVSIFKLAVSLIAIPGNRKFCMKYCLARGELRKKNDSSAICLI